MQVIITRLPITPDDRITVPESEVGILLQDLDKKRAPRSLPRPRPGSKRARRTLTLPRDAVDLVTARQYWDPGPWHDYATKTRMHSTARPSLLRSGGMRPSIRRRWIQRVVLRPSRRISGPSTTRTTTTGSRIAQTPSTTRDSVRGTSTKRKYFWFGGLLALVLWCLEYSAFQTLAFRSAVSK